MKNSLLAFVMLLMVFGHPCMYGQDNSCSNRASWWESEQEARQLGGVTLKKAGDKYFKRDNEANIRWLESYPGVLRKEKIQVPHHTELHFFNKEKELQEVLKLEEINPFWELVDKPISRGGYNFDYHKPASEEFLAENPEPTEYLTIFYGAHTNPSHGITIAHYGLTVLHGYTFLGMKSALLLIGPDGNILNTLIENDAASGKITSDDGALLAYEYGGYLENPLTNARLGECRIYDFNEKEVVLAITPDKGQRIRAAASADKCKKLVRVSYVGIGEKLDTLQLDLIDLNRRERFVRFFPAGEFIDTWNRYQSYEGIISQERSQFRITGF